MTEVARFFDSASYGESDQAEVQTRFRATGVLPEVGNRLRVTAPGGMFVSVGTGEAMVEGFWYKNTSVLPIAIANNSGAQRIDRVVLRLNRTANTLSVVLIEGTPGGGPPALVQIAGGQYELLLADVHVNAGVLLVKDDMILNYTTFSGYQYEAPRTNLLDNPTFRVNQRNTTFLSTQAYTADRWLAGVGAPSSFYQGSLIDVQPGNMAFITPETAKAALLVRTANTADSTSTFWSIQQSITGDRMQPAYGQSLCLSWWTYSTRSCVLAFNVDNLGSSPQFRYLGRYAHGKANAWQFNWAHIPWHPAAGLGAESVSSFVLRFIQVAGSTYTNATHSQWYDISTIPNKYTPPDFTSPVQSTSDQFWIYQPKLEIGTYPTRFTVPDAQMERMACYRYLYVPPASAVLHCDAMTTTSLGAYIAPPVPMNGTPALFTTSPTFASGAGPVGNQVGILQNGGWVTGWTINNFVFWVGSKRESILLLGSSSVSSQVAGMGSGLVLGQQGVIGLSSEP